MNEQTMPKALPIGEQQLLGFTKVLEEYNKGLKQTKSRIISNENWWKLRNDSEEEKESEVKTSGFKSKSGWLHNVLVSKHADAMEAYPEPNILPREEGDKAEAKMLTSIIPCIFEQNHFEKTYSDNMWQKVKFGTGVYKVVWDSSKLNGLGDIGIECANILNLYWEPGITDIQKRCPTACTNHVQTEDTSFFVVYQKSNPHSRLNSRRASIYPSRATGKARPCPAWGMVMIFLCRPAQAS